MRNPKAQHLKTSPPSNKRDLGSRVLALQRGLRTGPVKVSLYEGANTQATQSDKTLRQLLLAVTLLACGAMGATAFMAEPPPATETNDSRRVAQGRVVDLAPDAHCRASITTRMHVAHGAFEQRSSQLSNFDSSEQPIRFIEVNYLGRRALAIDEASRIRLSKQAAAAFALDSVGLGWEDVYAVVSAETAWIPRTGMGKNGVPSHGLGQFEPATANALNIKDPNDPVAAVHGVAALIKEAAQWSAARIRPLRMPQSQRADKLREGISVYYNLSTATRKTWNGANLDTLPAETQFHVRNVKDGRAIALVIDRKLQKAAAAQQSERPHNSAGSTDCSQPGHPSFMVAQHHPSAEVDPAPAPQG